MKNSMQYTEETNQMEEYRSNLFKQVEIIRDKQRQERKERWYISEPLFLTELRQFLRTTIGQNFPNASFDLFDIDFIQRGNFQADVVFKSTKLISQNKATYIKEICPNLAEILRNITISGTPLFEDVQWVGIYINAQLQTKHLFLALQKVLSLGDAFGNSDIGKNKDIVIDYSSPNAAKHLHAWHIRSTIIGHVLGNIYEACGYTVHRINYLNDWGGMGFLMEGLSKRSDIDSYENKNDLLFEIYSTFRKAQKVAESEDDFHKMTPDDIVDIGKLIWEFLGFPDFSSKFATYTELSNKKFASLENGDKEAFVNWNTIVEWSMEDFKKFYDILWVQQEYLTWESLYSKPGKDMVLREVASSKENIAFFDSEKAKILTDILDTQLQMGVITQEAYDRDQQEILSDIGSYVVQLDNNERFVVLKKDGATIYATRDLAALDHRIRTFSPEKIIYEVWQEQQEHFDKLFRSIKSMDIAKDTQMRHIYHGFYVDEKSKKKLSSRDGASNIMKLLADTIAYFRSKYDGNTDFSESEKDTIAKVLWVWSIVFNDIKKDRKSSVGISSDLITMMKQFEESWGAYLIYTSCRAKSVIRKYNKPLPEIGTLDSWVLLNVEIDLIKKILSFPDVISKAWELDDTVKIAEFLTSLASAFNSYYNSVPILKGDAIDQRIIITQCVATVIDNGLKILHIGTLERI